MPNERPGVDAEWRFLLAFLRPWPRATQAERSPKVVDARLASWVPRSYS
jgi:hypothetical protein